MSAKLIKNEFVKTLRPMFIMYLIFLLLSGIISVAISMNFEDFVFSFSGNYELLSKILTIVSILFVALFVILAFSVSVLAYFLSIHSFKENILKSTDESISAKQRIFSIAFVFAVWTVLSIGIIMLANLIIFFSFKETELFRILQSLISRLRPQLPEMPSAGLLIAGIVIIPFSDIMQIFASMTIGYRANRLRKIKSAGTYVLTSILFYFVGFIIFTGTDIAANSSDGFLILVICMWTFKFLLCFFTASLLSGKKLSEN